MTTPISAHELNRRLAVWRPETVPDGAGGQTITFTNTGDVEARVARSTAAEELVAAQAGATHTHRVFLRPDADVARGDELRGDGQTLRVKATLTPSEPLYLRADAELIEHEPGDGGS